MAKGNCPLCGGSITIGAKVGGVFTEGATPKRGARNWKCKKDGDDPNCKGWGFYGNKREEKTGAAEGITQPEKSGTAEPTIEPTGAADPSNEPAPVVEPVRKRGSWLDDYIPAIFGK